MEISQTLIDFIRVHASDDVVTLRLKFSGKQSRKLDFDLDFALLQIEARQKSKKKIPGFLKYPEFLFPTLLSAEQASNEAVARFHSSLFEPASSILDLTAGLGIDDMTFAQAGINVTACEIDAIKCDALRHNSEVLGVSQRLSVIESDSIGYIRNNDICADVVFADPARRNDSGVRLHALSDCQPDILGAFPDIMAVAPRLIVKCSPLLDLTLIRNSVTKLSHIYVVCFRGECKEVLIDVQNDSSFTGVTVVDLDWDSEISRFHTGFVDNDSLNKSMLSDRNKASDYHYLYEPNAGVMKTGAWSSLVSMFPDLSKADTNTHIFLSDTLYKAFPGKVMQICSEPDKKALKALKGEKINVVARNHPLSAPQVMKKFSLTPGSDGYLYAFRYRNTPVFLKTKEL